MNIDKERPKFLLPPEPIYGTENRMNDRILLDKLDNMKCDNAVSFHPTFDLISEDSPRSSGTSGDRRDSFANLRKTFTKRASQIILEVPVNQLRKLKETEGVHSWRRETKHFADNTTLHGPKRIYYGKGRSTVFWIIITLLSLAFLTYQISVLSIMYFARPTVSQVSFLIDEDGLDFPLVTLCNFNPFRKSYIKRINITGDFSDNLLDYIMLANEDVQVLYGNVDRAQLQLEDGELSLYQSNHTNFTIEGFYMDAGFECNEIMKLCTFGGRQFDCCKYSYPVLTSLGKCYTVNLQNSSSEWLQKQTVAGVSAGLQIILDTHLEEQFDGGNEDDPDPIFSNSFENGYRFYVHPADSIPYLSSEGISVSPSVRVYSAITAEKYVLLSSDQWGNCTAHWPPGYSTTLPYSSDNCASLCKARFFHDNCGCSPFTFNIDSSFPVCTPYQTSVCIDKYVRVTVNGTDFYPMPKCAECLMGCHTHVYHAYNSYGHGFSNGALRWLKNKNPLWTVPHVKANFLTINVFFRDMGHTEYTQVKAISLTEILSDIGGNMGMFLGMSFITIMEVSLYLSKVSWIVISKKRRDYMLEKKRREEESQKQLEETVSEFKTLKSLKEKHDKDMEKKKSIGGSMRRTRKMIRHFGRKISTTFGDRKRAATVSTDRTYRTASLTSLEKKEANIERNHNAFLNNKRKNNMYNNTFGDSIDSGNAVMELRLNVDDLCRGIKENRPVDVQSVRRRSHTDPLTPSPKFFVSKEDEKPNNPF